MTKDQFALVLEQAFVKLAEWDEDQRSRIMVPAGHPDLFRKPNVSLTVTLKPDDFADRPVTITTMKVGAYTVGSDGRFMGAWVVDPGAFPEAATDPWEEQR